MKTFAHQYRRPIVVAVHVVLVIASNLAAFLLRFDGTLPPEHVAPLLLGLPILLAVRCTTFWFFRLYEGLWRYASIWDLRNIIVAVAMSSVVFFGLNVLVSSAGPYPRSVYVIDSVLLIGLLGGARMARRVHREFDRISSEKRVLIYGAGDAGEMIVRDIRNNRFYNLDPVGFVDDDPRKVGQSIHGVRVLGTRDDLPRILQERQPHELIVAIPTANVAVIRGIVRALETFKLPIKTLPNLRDVLEGKIEVSQIRNLSLEDLMPRKPVGLDAEPVRRLINGRRVLVTGAGGSIGSELSRQVAALGPESLILLDRYENSLFDLCNDLAERAHAALIVPLIGDITDQSRLTAIFEQYRPEIVLHAAAHKHVPLMEHCPCEAVKNNVRGTRLLSETSAAFGVEVFVLISSDKAVNPSSVMGTTKRIAEGLIRAAAPLSDTRFVGVRFGNVLGSNGSVAGIFADQIARGGPVTVTHPDMSRYFMLIPEAVQLVLQAAAMPAHGAIYALDMGEPIKIVDLARNLIRLSGFVPDQDIAIRFSGLRPGEKLVEELVEQGELAEPSDVIKILRVESRSPAPLDVRRIVPLLEAAADRGSDREVVALLSEIVPSFRGGLTRADTPESHHG